MEATTLLEIAVTALAIWWIGHSWIHSFFVHKGELINRTFDNERGEFDA